MTNSKEDFVFNGFEPANTTPVPDILFDELLSWLSGSELKVLLYIIRRTRGFKKDSDAISLSQFQHGIITKDGKQLDKGCGIDDRQTIINALASLEKKRCIVSEKCKTAKGDNATTVYRILFSQGVVGKANQGSREKSTTLVGNSNHRSGKKPTTVVGNSNPQETVLQQTDTQETDLQDESNSDDTTQHTFVSSDTARASFEIYGDIVPYTFVEALAYLAPHGGVPPGYGAIEVVKLAQKLYAEAHSQDEQVFTDEKPQGDDHAVAPASGHSHRLDDAAACGDDTSHTAMDSGQVATPEDRPVLEAQEIDKGDTQHAHTLPVVPATNLARSGQPAASRHSQDDSPGAVGSGDVRSLGTTLGSNPSENGAGTVPKRVAQTPTTPMPAQSLSLPQAEQAASGQSPKGKGKKQAESKPETPKGPPTEPPADMAWGTRKCLMWFDFWRGGILIGKWKLMQASTCAKGLAEQFDEQTVIQARTDMEADPYYAAKGGCDVCDVANNIHKYLKRRQGKQQPAIQPALKVVKRYSSYDDPNFRSDQDFYPVEGGSYATASR